jgi:hypothetical protein
MNGTGLVKTLTRPGSGSTGSVEFPFYKVSLKNQTYPWMYWHNSTNSEDVGTIFMDLFPTSTTWGSQIWIYYAFWVDSTYFGLLDDPGWSGQGTPMPIVPILRQDIPRLLTVTRPY